MAEKNTKVDAPAEGAFLMHLDEFLNLMHDEIKNATGHAHVESLSAFAKQVKGDLRKAEADWRKDLNAFMSAVPK